MRVCLIALGCPKNQVDGETMAAALAGAGHLITPKPELADVVVVHTCGFIRAAQEESIGVILDAAQRKQDGRLRYLIASGCLAQRSGHELLDGIPELDAAVGTGDIGQIADVIASLDGKRQVALIGAPGFLPGGVLPRLLSTHPWTAYLKVSEGCDNRCAYCVIPDLRGPHRSRPAVEIAAEMADLVAAGVKEVTLVGQDLTRWGSDLPGSPQLPDLLTQLGLDRSAPHWLRLHYLHPGRVTDRLLRTMAELEAVCDYLDVPMQHGSDAVLSAMRRGTTAAGLRTLVARARQAMPEVALRSSFIVGFPGETYGDFFALRRLLWEIEADWIGVFSYSRELGTPAAEMPGQVPAKVKIRRRALAMALQRGISRRRALQQLGRTLEVLVEGPPRRVTKPDGAQVSCAPARSYREALGVDGTVWLQIAAGDIPPSPGTFVTARVVATDVYDLFAEQVFSLTL